MEDFFYAGGLPRGAQATGAWRQAEDRRAHRQRRDDRRECRAGDDLSTRTSSGRSNNPLVASDSLAVLRGNLAPDGAIIKPPAAESRLHKHAGKAVVFEDYNDMAARIDDPDLDVDENSVLVLQNAGPIGAPGMPEWGQLPIPKKLLAKGVRDMVRISDARMSGTSLRRLRPACRAGILHRRAARPGARRRRHRARHPRPPPELACERRGARKAPRRVAQAAAPLRARLRAPVLAST